jgi:hypothetical protein
MTGRLGNLNFAYALDADYVGDCRPGNAGTAMAVRRRLSQDARAARLRRQAAQRTDLGMIGKNEIFYQVIPADGAKIVANADNP